MTACLDLMIHSLSNRFAEQRSSRQNLIVNSMKGCFLYRSVFAYFLRSIDKKWTRNGIVCYTIQMIYTVQKRPTFGPNFLVLNQNFDITWQGKVLNNVYMFRLQNSLLSISTPVNSTTCRDHVREI